MKSIWIVAVVAVLALGGYLFFVVPRAEAPGVTDEKTYTSETYGISFSYPASYTLQEREAGNGERSHYAIVLIRTADLPPPENGEGPPAISIDLYQNNLDHMTAEGWIRGTNDSNFKLSPDGTLTPETVSGLPGFSYRWSGLYEADALAVTNDRFVYAFSGMYLTPEDQIRKDFEKLLKTVVIQ